MPNAILSIVLGSILVLSIFSVTSISDVDAKILDPSRADVTLSVGIVEATQDNGQSISKPAYATEANFDRFYEDMGRIHGLFNKLFVPSVKDFLERHKSELANKYTDILLIRYHSPSNEIFVSMWQSPKSVYETIKIDEPTSFEKLQLANQITMLIAVSQYLSGEEHYQYWLDIELANANAMVAYLTKHIQDALEKHKDRIVTDVDVERRGVMVNLIFGVSSAMFDDMSRVTLSYSGEHRTREYETGVQLALPAPPSESTLHERARLDLSKPIYFVKSTNQRIGLSAYLGLFGNIPYATLTYPDGNQFIVRPYASANSSENESDYREVNLGCVLKADDPLGLYELQIKTEADNVLSSNYDYTLIQGDEAISSYFVGRGDSDSFNCSEMLQSEPDLDRGWVAYPAESWCDYSRLMTVESPDASIFDERTNKWVTIYESLQQFGEFESTWSNVHFDNTNPMNFLHAIKWRVSGSPAAIDNAINAFNSFEPEMKKGGELSLYLVRGDCINAEGREFLIETETSYVIKDVKFNLNDKKISYVVDTGDANEGVFEVMIPKELLSGEFTLVVDGKPHYVTESVTRGTNETHTWLGYSHVGRATNIEAIGTEAIPEFPFSLIILATSFAGIIAITKFIRVRA